MKMSLVILLLAGATAVAGEPQFVFENRPARGLPPDAEAQQRSGSSSTNTTLRALLADSVVMVQVRYFNLTWVDQKQVQEYVSALLADPAIPAGSHYYWSQGLGEPEIECYLTLQPPYRQAKLLLWETAGAYQTPDGTWWFLNLFDYYHRAHPYGSKSPAARNAQFAMQAISNLLSIIPQLAPTQTDRPLIREYHNSLTTRLTLTNGAAGADVRVDSFASADQARLGLERSNLRPMHYTRKEMFEGGELYQWSTNALAGRVGPYVLDLTGVPGSSMPLTNAFAALAHELRSHIEDAGPTEAEAVSAALRALNEAGQDTSQHEMTAPESVQRLALPGGKAWRVSWRRKIPAGAPAVKGGQIVVLVYDSGRIESGFGE